MSISYALGSILGGAFAPTIATALVAQFGTTLAVSMYILVMVVVALAATMVLRDRRGIPLDVGFEESGKYHLFDPDRRPAETSAIMLEYYGQQRQ